MESIKVSQEHRNLMQEIKKFQEEYTKSITSILIGLECANEVLSNESEILRGTINKLKTLINDINGFSLKEIDVELEVYELYILCKYGKGIACEVPQASERQLVYELVRWAQHIKSIQIYFKEFGDDNLLQELTEDRSNYLSAIITDYVNA